MYWHAGRLPTRIPRPACPPLPSVVSQLPPASSAGFPVRPPLLAPDRYSGNAPSLLLAAGWWGSSACRWRTTFLTGAPRAWPPSCVSSGCGSATGTTLLTVESCDRGTCLLEPLLDFLMMRMRSCNLGTANLLGQTVQGQALILAGPPARASWRRGEGALGGIATAELAPAQP